jgi:hypothetical protein
MSCTFWKKNYCLHFVCTSVIIVCMCNILNRNSSKLCIHVYNHMYIAISIQNFDLTIFEGVIALFHLEYFIKKFVQATLTIHKGFTYHFVCLLITVWRFTYHSSRLIRPFLRSYCSFSHKIFPFKCVYWTPPAIYMGIPQNLPCLLSYAFYANFHITNF